VYSAWLWAAQKEAQKGKGSAMKRICITFTTLAALLAAANAETFTGVITDTMCGAKHAMMRDTPDDQCVKMCAKGQYAYALFDGANVLKLSDQKTPAKFAAQKVEVTGILNEKTKTIKVSSIQPVEGK
jgi:hypothetical protein